MWEDRETRIKDYLEKVRHFYGEVEADSLAALTRRVMKDRKPLDRDEYDRLKDLAVGKPYIGLIADELIVVSRAIQLGQKPVDEELMEKVMGEPEREVEPEVTMEELERAREEVIRHHAHPAYMTRYLGLRKRYERQKLAKSEAQKDTKNDAPRTNITKEDVEHARERAKSGNSRDIARYMMLRHQMEAAERDDD